MKVPAPKLWLLSDGVLATFRRITPVILKVTPRKNFTVLRYHQRGACALASLPQIELRSLTSEGGFPKLHKKLSTTSPVSERVTVACRL
jgi:hypothetical protein